MTRTELSALIHFSLDLRQWAQEDHDRLCTAPPDFLYQILDLLGDFPQDVIFTRDELQIRDKAFRALNRILILSMGGVHDGI